MGNTGTLTFKQEGGAQAPERFEGRPKDTLEGEYAAVAPGFWVAANVTTSVDIQDGEEVEVKTP